MSDPPHGGCVNFNLPYWFEFKPPHGHHGTYLAQLYSSSNYYKKRMSLYGKERKAAPQRSFTELLVHIQSSTERWEFRGFCISNCDKRSHTAGNFIN